MVMKLAGLSQVWSVHTAQCTVHADPPRRVDRELDDLQAEQPDSELGSLQSFGSASQTADSDRVSGRGD